MSKTGYISLHRKIKENSFWSDKPFSKGQAWIDLLLKVNHKRATVLIGNTLIEVEAGETVWSMKKMASDWGGSINKVGRFLNVLESESMVVQKRETKYTIITVVNWRNYQQSGNQTEIKRKSNGNQTETNNNDNNDNNIVAKATSRITSNTDPSAAKINEVFDYYIKKSNKNPHQYKLSKARRVKLKVRVNDAGVVMLKRAIDNLSDSDWHNGDNDRGWVWDLDYLIRSYENVEKHGHEVTKQLNGKADW